MNSTNPNELKHHTLQLISRSKLEIDGVLDVIDFDNSTINLTTSMGALQIEGENLKIISLSRENSKIYVEGTVDSLFYYNTSKDTKRKFFKRSQI